MSARVSAWVGVGVSLSARVSTSVGVSVGVSVVVSVGVGERAHTTQTHGYGQTLGQRVLDESLTLTLTPTLTLSLTLRTLGQRFLDDSEFVFQRVTHSVEVLVQVRSMDVVVSLRRGGE